MLLEAEQRRYLDQLVVSLHGDLGRVAFLGPLLGVHSTHTAQQLLLLSAHLLNKVVRDVLQDGVLGR